MLSTNAASTFASFLLRAAIIVLLLGYGLANKSPLLTAVAAAMALNLGFDLLSHYKVRQDDWAKTKEVHYTASVLAVSVGSVLIVFTDTPIFFTAVTIGCNTYFLFYAFSLTIDSLKDNKTFGRWQIIRSSLLLYVPTGLFFATLYKTTPYSLKNVGGNLDYIYYSFVTLSTTGYGDILPNNPTGKLLMMVESFIGGYVLLGVFIAGAFSLPETIKLLSEKAKGAEERIESEEQKDLLAPHNRLSAGTPPVHTKRNKKKR